MAKKLSSRDLESFRNLLLRARAVVSGDVSLLEEEALGGKVQRQVSDPRPGDTSESYYQELNLELLERDQSTLREIDEALQRIAEGSYGRCESCEELISRQRLRAVPHARNCIECQRKAERNGW